MIRFFGTRNEYVASHVDAVEYYNWDAFSFPTGPALGIAAYENGRRIIRVALKGRNDLEVVATLVHEAAHLSGLAQIGDLYDEDIAAAVERKFLTALEELENQERSADSNSGLQARNCPQ